MLVGDMFEFRGFVDFRLRLLAVGDGVIRIRVVSPICVTVFLRPISGFLWRDLRFQFFALRLGSGRPHTCVLLRRFGWRLRGHFGAINEYPCLAVGVRRTFVNVR